MKMAAVRKFALSLPDVSEAPHHTYGSFRVNGKIFVTFPPDEEFVHIFVPDAVREEALALHGDFAENLWWGSKILGIRVHLADADSAAVKRFIEEARSYKSQKPARKR
jgi:hypothetical protein